MRRLIVSCLLCLGFWQLGQGAYIPAKAWLAQELMQRAWFRTQQGDGEVAPPRARADREHPETGEQAGDDQDGQLCPLLVRQFQSDCSPM